MNSLIDALADLGQPWASLVIYAFAVLLGAIAWQVILPPSRGEMDDSEAIRSAHPGAGTDE